MAIEEEVIKIKREYLEKNTQLNRLPEELRKEFIELLYFQEELNKESERGCALLAASYIDALTERMLRARVLGSKNELDELFNFNGPLGSFSSRIQIAYSLGLISKFFANDLQLIRKIRNEFGHSPRIINFEDKKIKTFCEKMKLVSNIPLPNRAKYTESVSFVVSSLLVLTFQGKKFKEKEEYDLEHFKMDEFLKIVKDKLPLQNK